MSDKTAKGRNIVGGQVLTEDEVREVRQLLAAGHAQADIGYAFGVSQGAIGAISTGRNWGSLPDEKE
jgi:hypothetical protein